MSIASFASFAPLVRDIPRSQAFYSDDLGLTFEGGGDGYIFTDRMEGSKHFGLWPLSDAARSCFGTPEWPIDVPVPQACIEFELESVAAVADAVTELQAKGHRILRTAQMEPWQQTTARLLSPEGLLVGLCYTPWFHPQATGQALAAEERLRK